MTSLDRKLLRDLRLITGQCVTIALMVACGIAAFISALSNYDSLQWARDSYYEEAALPISSPNSSARQTACCGASRSYRAWRKWKGH